MIDLNKPCEGIDYVIVPLDGTDNEQAWQVVIQTGQFKDTAMLFTNIEYSGAKNQLKFRLDAVRVDGSDVIIDESMQDYSFSVLEDIIKTGLANGSIVIDDKDSNN